jgi:hypothetical protein
MDMGKVGASNLDSFDKYSGVRPGIEACRHIVDYYFDMTKWEDGPENWLKENVFKLATDAGPANTEIVEYNPTAHHMCDCEQECFLVLLSSPLTFPINFTIPSCS